MKLLISIIAVLVLTASLAAAGTVPTEQGDKAMVFTFHGFDHLGLGTYPGADLGMFMSIMPEEDYYEEYRDDDEEMLDMLAGFTGGLGMRYYIADNTAIRGGLLFSMASATIENDAEGWTDNEMSLSSFGVELVYERHIDVPYEPISPYLGVAGNFSMTTLTTEPSHMEDLDDDDCYWYDWCQMTKAETSITTFGIAGVLGFEWAFVDGMTLGGEYRLGFRSMSAEMTEDYECCEYEDPRDITTETCEDNASASMMGFSTTALMLSVYW